MCINSHSVPFPWIRTHCASAERRHSGNTNERMAMKAENDHAPVRRPEHGELLQRAQNLPSTSDMAAHERFRRDPAGGNGAMHCVMHAFHEPILSRETKSDSFTKILIVLVFSRQATTCDGSVHTRVHACNRHRSTHGWLKRKPFRANTVFITRQTMMRACHMLCLFHGGSSCMCERSAQPGRAHIYNSERIAVYHTLADHLRTQRGRQVFKGCIPLYSGRHMRPCQSAMASCCRTVCADHSDKFLSTST